jgi:uncharacterized membrane protein YfcA
MLITQGGQLCNHVVASNKNYSSIISTFVAIYQAKLHHTNWAVLIQTIFFSRIFSIISYHIASLHFPELEASKKTSKQISLK